MLSNSWFVHVIKPLLKIFLFLISATSIHEGKDTATIGRDALGLPKHSANAHVFPQLQNNENYGGNNKKYGGNNIDYGGSNHDSHGSPQDINVSIFLVMQIKP